MVNRKLYLKLTGVIAGCGLPEGDVEETLKAVMEDIEEDVKEVEGMQSAKTHPGRDWALQSA